MLKGLACVAPSRQVFVQLHSDNVKRLEVKVRLEWGRDGGEDYWGFSAEDRPYFDRENLELGQYE